VRGKIPGLKSPVASRLASESIIFAPMKDADALFMEHHLIAFIDRGVLTVRAPDGKELVTNNRQFVTLGKLANGAARVLSPDAGEVKLGESFYTIQVGRDYWQSRNPPA
jgi:hypothetical protein